MQLLINDNDVSNHIIAGSYAVNSTDEYSSWVDANGLTHRNFTRSRVKGSFDMFFRTERGYNTFLAILSAAKRQDLTYKITLDINNKNETVTRWFFLTLETTRDIDGKWQDYFKRFTVKIEER